MKKKVLSLLLASTMFFSLASCGKDAGENGAQNNSGNTEVSGAEAPSYTYNLYMDASPTNWNPHAWEMNADSTIMSYLEMGLVDSILAEDGVNFKWEMEMAESITDITASFDNKDKYEIGADETGRVWEIKLNKNAKWEDGKVINADTYVYSMQQLLSSDMKNYRAGNYVSGDSAIYNADAYFNNDKVGQPLYSSVVKEYNEAGEQVIDERFTDGVYYLNVDEPAYFFGADTIAAYINAGYAASYPSFAELEQYVGAGYVEVTDELKATLTALAQELGDTNPTAWMEMCVGVVGTYEETPWEDVGLVKVDDYTILYITALPVDQFNFYTACSSNWIVYEDLYEAGKSTTGDLVATTYGTSADSYKAYGPYKLASFETEKQFVLEKNENWYGYTDGKHEGQFQTTKVVYQIVADHNTQLQLFESGQLDGVGLTADDMAKYRLSDNILKTDTTYTFRFIFATDLEALKGLEAEANDGANKRVLSYPDFRKALSLAMDRVDMTTNATSGYKPAYFLLNSLYYYDIANNSESIYRNTDEAKAAVLNVYGIEYTDENIDEKYASVTGYDVEEAKKLFQSVYEQAIADGNYTDGQAIKIRCCVAAASELTAEDMAQQDCLNKYVTAATVGTGFEGKITFEFFSGLPNRYDDVAGGKVEMIRGAWGGAAFYPFNAARCYTDASYAGTIHESCGWDPTVNTLDITYDFDGDGAAETVTDTFYNWSIKISASGELAGDIDARLFVLAALETGIITAYQCIPWATETACELYSYKIKNATDVYNIMYAYGGIRFMTYNYNDAEWEQFVKDAGGTLNYE